MRFILGASGSGKTSKLYKDIIERSINYPKENFIILVPEQYTMQTQKYIVEQHPYHATDNIDVLSFNRLAYRIFTELSIVNPDIIDDIDKVMIIRKLAIDKQKELGVWKYQFSKSGFIDDMKSMVSELYQYGIDLNKLEEVLDSRDIDKSLRQKLSDLSVIYKSFIAYTKDKYISTEEIPDILARHIERSELIKNSSIMLDGFTGFTPIQYRIIEKFLMYARELSCTITIGSDEDIHNTYDESDLFFMSKNLHKKICDICRKLAIKDIEYIDLNAGYSIENSRFAESKSLYHLENYFLRYKKFTKIEAGDDIDIIRAADIDEEVDALVSRILFLTKEKGLRYKDIAILSADMQMYADKFKQRCRLHNIPQFIDENISLKHNILIEFISALLYMMKEEFSYNSVMRYLRSPILSLDYSLIASLDDYMYICGIKGLKALSKDWVHIPGDFTSKDLDRINVYKEELVKSLSPLYKLCKSKKSKTKDMIEKIKQLLESLDTADKLKAISKEFDENSESELATEYDKVYEEVRVLLDKLEELLGEEHLSIKEFIELMEAGFSQLSLGTIPAKLDRVFFGDLKRSRIDSVKALFILGANDGIIPKLKSPDSILNDREKQSLKTAGIELSSTVKEDLLTQRYYLYMNISKSSKYLFISYSAIDNLGGALRPSYLIEMIKRLYIGLESRSAKDILGIYSKAGLKEAFIRDFISLRKSEFQLGDESTGDREFRSIYRYISSSKLVEATLYRDRELNIGKKVARALYGIELKSSVTALEKYVDCPYAYFIKYGLDVNSRRAYGMEAVDIGVLLHSLIENFFRRSEKSGIELKKLNKSDIHKLVEASVGELMLREEFSLYKEEDRQKYSISRLSSMAEQSIYILVNQLKLGDFTPLWHEKTFSYKDGPAALNLRLSDDEYLRLRGKIDRVDICELEDSVLVKIIDYKTGSTKWELDMTYHAKQIQLITYLSAIEQILAAKYPEKTVKPAAFMYIHLDDPIFDMEEVSTDEQLDKALLKSFRPSGIVNTDLDIVKHLDTSISGYSDVIPVIVKDGIINEAKSSVASSDRIDKLKKFVETKSKDLAKDILRGDISIAPVKRGTVTACDYCEYTSVCRFDTKNQEHRYKILNKIKDDEVWENILNVKEMD